MAKKQGPTVKTAVPETHGAGGVRCCCCLRCCTCVHIEFLKTLPGVIKVLEAVSVVLLFTNLNQDHYKVLL